MKHPKQLLVITSFPPKDTIHHPKIVGVASYTKNTLQALPQDTEITVLAEQLHNSAEAYQEKNITVKRIWKRSSISLYPNLVKEIILYHKDIKDVMLALEIAMFGDKLSLALLPIFLFILRLTGKNVTIVMHQVITDIKEMSGHVYTYSGITAMVINMLLVLYYKAILLNTSQCIVMDEVLRKRLQKYGKAEKIIVIPHGVETFKAIPSQQKARKKLHIKKNTFVILYFGFLAYYKGADLIANAFSHIPASKRKHVKLILAGGPNPNHSDKLSYTEYIQHLETLCIHNDITISGFVAEKDIPFYFQAADVVIFPYRTLMSSSGPLSMSLSFEKPFLLSQQLAKITETKDIKEYLKASKLPVSSFVIDTQKEFNMTISKLIKDKNRLRELTTFSKAMKQKRAWSEIGKMYTATLFTQ